MHRVDFVHRVFGIGQPHRLRGWMHLAFQSEFGNQKRMGIVPVVDELGAGGYVAAECFESLFLRWLRGPFGHDDEAFPVGRGRYRDFVPRYAAEPLPFFGDSARLVHGNVGLVDPNFAGEDDGFLAPLQNGEDLPEPINAGGSGVSVVPGRGFCRMELEEVEEEFRPFRRRDFAGAENGVGQGVESFATRSAEVFLHPVAPFAVPDDIGGSAVGASVRAGRVDHGGFLRGELTMLFGIPLGDGGIHQSLRRRKRPALPLWVRFQRAGPAWVFLFIHVWRFASLGGRLDQTAKFECPGGLRSKTLSDLF